MYLSHNVSLVTTHVLQNMKNNGEKIAMLTAYDYSMAKILDESNIDIILVGDSASNVMAGYKTTLPITLNEMIYHASSVCRAVKRSFVVVDLPFGTYQGNSKEALNSAIRIMKESGANAVKMEGGREILGYKDIKDHTRQQTEVYKKSFTDESGNVHKENTKVSKPISIYDFWDFRCNDCNYSSNFTFIYNSTSTL